MQDLIEQKIYHIGKEFSMIVRIKLKLENNGFLSYKIN